MMTLSLKKCDQLDGAHTLEAKATNAYGGSEIWEHVEKVIATPTNLSKLATHNKEEAKAK
jgi:hypothetical protein